MKSKKETIFIVDDDKSLRRSLSLYLNSVNYKVETYCSSEEFLSKASSNDAGCIILDVNLGGKTGLELQDELNVRNSHLPIIFITGQGSIPMSVNTLKKGAINFLEKPFSEEEILKSVSEALELSRNSIEEKEEFNNAKNLIDALTPREYEILEYILTGMLNKQIAHELNIAEQTVKIHRGSIYEKLGVKSVPEIMRIAEKAGVKPAKK